MVDPKSTLDYSQFKGILKFQNKLYIGQYRDLRSKVLHALHDSSMGGHSGIHGTYKRVSQLFHWPGLKKDVESFVKKCEVCQMCKPDNHHPARLLQPLAIPTQLWSHISLDFIEGLPKSEGKDTVLVVIDRLSKYAHFLSLSHPFNASKVARLFLDNIYKLHGLPQSIVSD